MLLDIYNAYSNLVKKSDNILIVLDEAQEIEGWERFVRGLSEKGVKFLITGSSSKLLSSEFSTLLSGRSININIMPLSFTEFLLFNNIKITERNAIPFNMEKIAKLLEEYIKYGGMPAAVLHKDIKENLIISYFDTIIVRQLPTAKAVSLQPGATMDKKITPYNRLVGNSPVPDIKGSNIIRFSL